jgi:hypothetical protein
MHTFWCIFCVCHRCRLTCAISLLSPSILKVWWGGMCQVCFGCKRLALLRLSVLEEVLGVDRRVWGVGDGADPGDSAAQVGMTERVEGVM